MMLDSKSPSEGSPLSVSAPTRSDHAARREARQGPARECTNASIASMGASLPTANVGAHALLRESGGDNAAAAAAAAAMRRADNAFERYSSTDNMRAATPLGDHHALREARRGPHECSNGSIASMGASLPKHAGAHALLRESFGGSAAAASAAADAMRRADLERCSSVDVMGASAPSQGEHAALREAKQGSKFACSYASMGSSQPTAAAAGMHALLRESFGDNAAAVAAAAAAAMRTSDNAFERYSSVDNMGPLTLLGPGGSGSGGHHATLREAKRGPHECSNNSIASMGASLPKNAGLHAALRESFGGNAAVAAAAASVLRRADFSLDRFSSVDNMGASAPSQGEQQILREGRPATKFACSYASMGSSQPMHAGVHRALRGGSTSGGDGRAVMAAAAADAMRKADNAFERYSSTDNMGVATTLGDHHALREARRGPHECSNNSIASMGTSLPKHGRAHGLLRESFGGNAAAASAAADAMRRADLERCSSADNMGAVTPLGKGDHHALRDAKRTTHECSNASLVSLGASQPRQAGQHALLRESFGASVGAAALNSPLSSSTPTTAAAPPPPPSRRVNAHAAAREPRVQPPPPQEQPAENMEEVAT